MNWQEVKFKYKIRLVYLWGIAIGVMCAPIIGTSKNFYVAQVFIAMMLAGALGVYVSKLRCPNCKTQIFMKRIKGFGKEYVLTRAVPRSTSCSNCNTPFD